MTTSSGIAPNALGDQPVTMRVRPGVARHRRETLRWQSLGRRPDRLAPTKEQVKVGFQAEHEAITSELQQTLLQFCQARLHP